MIEPASDDRLSQLMKELGPAEPPAGLRRQVMARIEQQQSTERISPFNRRGIAMTKKAMYGIAAAAALALGTFAVTGFPPVGRGTEGTIGAAKKYQAPQMDSKDVVLGDAAAQEFLQSDAFDRIVKDPQARKLLSDPGVQSALKNNMIANALRDQGLREIIASDAFARLFADDAVRAQLADSYKVAAAGAAIKTASREAAARDVVARARDAVVRARENRALAGVLGNDALMQAILRSDLHMALTRSDLRPAFHNDAVVAALGARGFDASLATGKLATAMAAQ